jgi:dimethylglycine dehydrogenase
MEDKQYAQVVIVGGGIAGCALAYQLARCGCEGVVLIEKAELTSGSTWHAAGNVPLLMGGVAHALLHTRSLDLYAELAELTGNPLGFHRSGSLQVATSTTEHREQREHAELLQAHDIRCEIVGSDEAVRLFPYLNPRAVEGGAWTPDDGHLDPSTLTFAFADAARDNGARIIRHTPVVEICASSNGAWTVRGETLQIETEHVVNSAGLHGREVSAMVGHRLAAVPMERQYIVTDDVPGIEQNSCELPVLRDSSGPFYIRQERNSLLLGLYDQEPVFWARDGTPDDFAQELLTPDLDRVSGSLQAALHRIPLLETLGIKTRLNGPLMRTPDAAPLVGPVAGLKNFWLNTGYFGGIAQAGACTEILARWIVGGDPQVDTSLFDARRFGDEADAEYTMRLTREEYLREFDRSV